MFPQRLFLLIICIGVSTTTNARLGAAEVLVDIAAVRTLTREETAREVPVRLRGVVTWRYVREEFAVEDGTGGIWVQLATARKYGIWKGDEAELDRIHEGTELEIEGVTNPAGYAPAISPSRIRILGEKPLPPARPLDRVRFFNGHESGQRVEARGVVLGCTPMDDSWRLRMQSGADLFMVMLTSKVLRDPRPLLGAELLVRGVGGCGFNTRGEYLNARIMVSRSADLIEEKPAPMATFDAPAVPMDQLRAFSSEPTPPRRVRVEGLVTAVMPDNRFFLQAGHHVIRVESLSAANLKPGDLVEAVGFVDMTRHIGGLGGAEVRKTGSDELPAAEEINPERIMEINIIAANTGQAAQPHDYDGHRIRFRASLLSVRTLPDRKKSRCWLSLRRQDTVVEAHWEGQDHGWVDRLQPGSELEVTGVVQLEYGTVEHSRSFLQPVQLGVLLQRAEDVAVVRTPPWWTPQRFVAVIAAGGLMLGAALLWVWQLRRQVRSKTHELASEMRARREAAVEFRATLRERNRLAADLHDTLLQTMSGIGFQLEACEAEGAAANAGLTGAGAAASGTKGRDSLGVARRMLDVAVTELRNSVWALRSLPLQGMSLAEVLESMAAHARSLHPTQIEVRAQDVGPVPDFVAGNLLLAAQEALHNALKHGKPQTVTIEVRRGETEGSVAIEVRDDGAGFVPGTQAGAKQGHFGLAGMAERMERLAGNMRIESAPGKGTTIRLEVPVRSYDPEVS